MLTKEDNLMYGEDFWKEMYLSQVEDLKVLEATFLGIYDKSVQEELGVHYDSYKDLIIVSELMEFLGELEGPNDDPRKTPDDRAYDIAAMYRVIKFFLPSKDYQEFVEGRRDSSKGLTDESS